MAQARQQLSDSQQVESRIASYGILPETPDPSPEEEQAEQSEETESKEAQESDERTDADASGQDEETQEEAQAEGSEAEEEDEGEQEQESADSRVAALEAQVAKLEEDSRRWQSRYDRSQADLQRMMERGAPSAQTQTESGLDLSGIPDDDVVTGKQVKDLLGSMQAQLSAREQQTRTQSQRQQWVSSRPDIQEVKQFMHDNDLFAEDSPLRNMATDEVGLYHAARGMMLERKVQDAEKKAKEEVEKALAAERKKAQKKKPAIPPTGGNGAPRGTRTYGESLEPQSQGEKQYLDFFRKIDPSTSIVSGRR